MSTRAQIECAAVTPWQKIYRWFRAVDEALNVDPAAQLQTSVHQLSERQRQLEAVLRRLEAPANSQSEGGK